MARLSKNSLYLALLLVAAACLRLYHIRFGEPFLYHPDEIKLVAQAGRLLSSHFTDVSAYFAIGVYPPFFTYLLALPIGLYIVWNFLTGRFATTADVTQFYDLSPFPFFLISRLLVAFMGVLSVWLLYRLVKRLYSERVAWIASVLLAFNFLHIQQSHYATVDLPASLFALLAVSSAVSLLEKPRPLHYFTSALFAAMALATKFSLFFAVAPALYAHLCHAKDSGWSWKNIFNRRLFLLAATLVIAFLLFCPLFVLDFSQTRQGLQGTGQFEKEGKLGSGGSLLSYWTGDQSEGFGVFYPNDFLDTLGPVLMAITLVGLFLMVRRHRRADLLLLSFTLLTYFMFEYVAYKAIRHLLPIVPFLMVAAALALESIAVRLSRQAERRNAVLLGMVLALAVAQAGRSGRYFSGLAKPDPRTISRAWILQNIPAHSRIMTESFPPALPNCRDARPDSSRCYHLSSLKLTSRRLNLTPEFISALRDSGAQYYLADGFSRVFFDWKHSYKKYPQVVQERKQFFAWLEANAKRLQTFKPATPRLQPEIVIYQLPVFDGGVD